MGKSAPSAPTPPDPQVTAAAQAASNIETARANAELNRINQYTPWGNLTYTRTPTLPAWDEQSYLAANPDVATAVKNGRYASGLEQYQKIGINENRTGIPAGFDLSRPDGWDAWSSTITLSPEQQSLLDLQSRAQKLYGTAAVSQLDRLQGILGQPFNPNLSDVRTVGLNTSMPADWQTADSRSGELQRSVGPEDFSADRQRVEEALFGRLTPRMDQQRLALENRLTNQGLVAGSEAWRNAVDDFGRQENDARLAVTAAGGQEQQRLFDMALARANFANTATGTAFGMDQQAADMANRVAQGEIARRAAENAARVQQTNSDMALRQMLFGEQAALRQMPLNEAAALLTGQQVRYPQFAAVPGATVAPTDVLGAQNMSYNGQLAGYQGDVAAVNSANSGTAAVGAAALTAAAIIA